MTCKPIKTIDGRITGISCGRGSRKYPTCHACGNPFTSLCDATREDGKPCDLPMCDEHKNRIGEDTDVCKFHNYPTYIEQAKKNRVERGEDINNQVNTFLNYAKRKKADEGIKEMFDDWDKDILMDEELEKQELIKLINKSASVLHLERMCLNDLRVIVRYINTLTSMYRYESKDQE